MHAPSPHHSLPTAGRTPSRPAAGGRAVATLAAFATVTLLLLTAAPGSAAAAVPTAVTSASTDVDPGAVSWGLAPADTEHGEDRANYAYAVDPGENLDDVLVVTNHSDVPLDLRVYAADAFTTTSGQLDLLPAGEDSTGVGAWLRPEVDALTLGPGETAEVPFTLEVPADARPGDHSGGIITSLVQPDGDSTVALDRRLALRVHARVSGALSPALEVHDVQVVHHGSANPFATSTATVRYAVTNTGNARLVPIEQVGVAGVLGWGERVAVPSELPELLPGSTLEREVTITDVRPLLRATADVVLHGQPVGLGGGEDLARGEGAASTWAVPWAALALLLLVVAAAVWGPALWSRLRGRATGSSTGSPPAASSVGALADDDAVATPDDAAAPSAPPRHATQPGPGVRPGPGAQPGPAAEPAPAVPSGENPPPAVLTPEELEVALERARAEGRAQALAEQAGHETAPAEAEIPGEAVDAPSDGRAESRADSPTDAGPGRTD